MNTDEKFLCGMRFRDTGLLEGAPDAWAKDGERTYCNYCGSMSGDEFMELVKAEKKIGVTTKNYKAYIDDHRKFYYVHLSAAQRQEFVDLYNKRKIAFEQFQGEIFMFNGIDCPFPFFMHPVEGVDG